MIIINPFGYEDDINCNRKEIYVLYHTGNALDEEEEFLRFWIDDHPNSYRELLLNASIYGYIPIINLLKEWSDICNIGIDYDNTFIDVIGDNKNNKLDVLKTLKEYGVTNYGLEEGLCRAITFHNMDVVKLIIIDYGFRDFDGPFQIACYHNNIEVIYFLCCNNNAKISDDSYHIGLCKASRYGYIDLMKILKSIHKYDIKNFKRAKLYCQGWSSANNSIELLNKWIYE